MTARTPADGPQPAAIGPTNTFSSLIQVDVSALSHTGHRRANNEDHFLVARVGRSLETLTTSLSPADVPTHTEEVNYVMVVADGMGGHAAGEVASRLAISTLIGLALEMPDWILRVDEGYAREIAQRSQTRVRKVGKMLVEQGQRDPTLKGMGTTLTSARSLGRDLVITHVGDSRAYLLRARQLHRLTRDHTYAQLLVDIGELAPSDVASSRHRHVLTNALGGSTEDVQVDTDRIPLADGDRVLLCSDGLTDLVDDDMITRTLSSATNAREACERLVQQALDSGGRDNVTVIVAVYRFPETAGDSA
jgi:serine/threonine protein phosphatase PrpC